MESASAREGSKIQGGIEMEISNKNNNTGGCGEKKNGKRRKIKRSEALQKFLDELQN